MNRFPQLSRLALSAAGLLLVAVTATAQTAQPAPASPNAPAAAATRIHEADQAFITDGTKTVSTQHDAARIADSRTSDSQVKAFAQRVSTDDEKIIGDARSQPARRRRAGQRSRHGRAEQHQEPAAPSSTRRISSRSRSPASRRPSRHSRPKSRRVATRS